MTTSNRPPDHLPQVRGGNRRHIRKAVRRLKNGTRYPRSRNSQNVENSLAFSNGYSADSGGRGSGIRGPRAVIESELAAITWTPIVPGSCVLVAQLRRPALVKP